MKMRKYGKKLAAILALGAVAAISISLPLRSKAPEETVREREYIAVRDTITVGVETSGLVDAGPNTHSFEAGTVVQELKIKVGSEVKKGDLLASVSTENLKELIETAQDELSDAKAALLQASSSKDVLIAQNNKDKQDGLDGVQQEYSGKIELLNSEKRRLETAIAEQEERLSHIRRQLEEVYIRAGDLEERVSRLEKRINRNILEIGHLNEELLKVDDGSDERNYLNGCILEVQHELQKLQSELEQAEGDDELSALRTQIEEKEARLLELQKALSEVPDGSDETSAIRLKITELQNENTSIQQEIDTYSADPAFEELERLKGEQKVCEDSLKSDYEALSLKLEEIERAEKQFQQALENQNGDNAFSDYRTGEELKSINESIAKASRNVQTAQEKVDRLQELAENPYLYAELDGIVTALNYKVGDTVVDGKPLCIVGELDEISITVPVGAADIGSVSVGQKVNIYVDAYAEQKFTGTVKERLLVANDNGEYPVTISIDPDEQLLLPGMKAYATIILKEKTDVLTLSNKAITLENGQQYVLVRDENGELVRKTIVTGFSDGRVSEILDGLAENEVVIVQE